MDAIPLSIELTGATQERTAHVLTIRCSHAFADALKEQAWQLKVSIQHLALAKLAQPLANMPVFKSNAKRAKPKPESVRKRNKRKQRNVEVRSIKPRPGRISLKDYKPRPGKDDSLPSDPTPEIITERAAQVREQW
jgi:hypothetical protein